MDIIVDANIIFSSLIKEGKTAELLFDLYFRLFAPEFILEEIENHKEEILEKTERTDEEFENIFRLIKELIIIIPEDEFREHMPEAKKICPDQDDVAYFALALKLKCPIWSNDKELKKQNIVKIYSTEELFKI